MPSDDLAQPGTPTAPGAPVHLNFRKWDGTEHWQFDATYLGTDEYGIWVGIPTGSHFERPGAQLDSNRDQVTLITDEGWAPVFHDQHENGHVQIYVDITTHARWERQNEVYVATLIDMDLDVVQLAGGHIYVDDEDEFAEHQIGYGYPADEITRCEADCARVLAMVQEHTGPFDGTGEKWLQAYLQRREVN